MTLFVQRCLIASGAENDEVDLGRSPPRNQRSNDGDSEDTRPERVDFVFRPPQPNELRVGVEVYYKTSDRSPSFAQERYGNGHENERLADY